MHKFLLGTVLGLHIAIQDVLGASGALPLELFEGTGDALRHEEVTFELGVVLLQVAFAVTIHCKLVMLFDDACHMICVLFPYVFHTKIVNDKRELDGAPL